jgi:hypothetical protein
VKRFLQRQPADPGPVLVLRADGPAAPGLPQHVERTEDKGNKDTPEITGRRAVRPSGRQELPRFTGI